MVADKGVEPFPSSAYETDEMPFLESAMSARQALLRYHTVGRLSSRFVTFSQISPEVERSTE